MAIERKFVAQNLKEFRIKEHVESTLSRVGLAGIKLQRTPLGDKIVVMASRPGLVVGRGGANIQKLTADLKNEFKLENPQIEIEELENVSIDANVIGEMIVNSLERFGSARFKGVGHKALQDVMNAGALGVEILISGKIPGSRAKTWRFYQGYLKKCGDVAVSGVQTSYKTAHLKTGAIGVKVSIMPPTTQLPDAIEIYDATIEEVTNVVGNDGTPVTEVAAPTVEEAEKVVEAPKAEEVPKKVAKKKSAKKTADKKEEAPKAEEVKAKLAKEEAPAKKE